MDETRTLPPAVLHRILSNLRPAVSHSDFSQYATVSRHWQETLEGMTFMELSLTPEKLRKLRSIVIGRRRSYVEHIRLRISLQALDPSLYTDVEIGDEQEISSVVFTKIVRTLFETLSKWKKDTVLEKGIQLHILFDSPSDRAWAPETPARRSTTSQLAMAVQLDPARLHRGSLPEVEVVTGLLVTGRRIKLQTLITLVSKLRGLRALDIEFQHDTKDDHSIRERIGFVRGLEEHGGTIISLRLRRPKASTTASAPAERFARNAFYDELRLYTMRCHSIVFDDCIDGRQFLRPFQSGPESSSTPTPLPRWEHLREVNIRNSYMLSRPYMRVRNRVVAFDHLHNLMVLVGRAAAQMPLLERLKLLQIILDDGSIRTSKLQYEWQETQTAVLYISGTEPTVEMLQTWRSSIARARGTSLHIDFNIETDSTGEELGT